MKFDLGLSPDADPETVQSELLKCMEAFLNPAEALLVCSMDCFCVVCSEAIRTMCSLIKCCSKTSLDQACSKW